jgi:hypothetical protein
MLTLLEQTAILRACLPSSLLVTHAAIDTSYASTTMRCEVFRAVEMMNESIQPYCRESGYFVSAERLGELRWYTKCVIGCLTRPSASIGLFSAKLLAERPGVRRQIG